MAGPWQAHSSWHGQPGGPGATDPLSPDPKHFRIWLNAALEKVEMWSSFRLRAERCTRYEHNLT